MSAPLRIGLMVPANNTTMERELLAWLPAGSACTTLRVPRGKGLLTPETVPDYKARALALAGSFAVEEFDLVAYGCTAASFISGIEGDARFADALAKITAKPVVTTAQAMVLALRDEGAENIALVTPYTDTVNDRLKAYLAASGIWIRCFNSFYAADVEELGGIGVDAVARLAAETMDEECDALFIACSQLPTYGIVGELRARFQRPVWSSVKATAWQAERMGARRAA